MYGLSADPTLVGKSDLPLIAYGKKERNTKWARFSTDTNTDTLNCR